MHQMQVAIAFRVTRRDIRSGRIHRAERLRNFRAPRVRPVGVISRGTHSLSRKITQPTVGGGQRSEKQLDPLGGLGRKVVAALRENPLLPR